MSVTPKPQRLVEVTGFENRKNDIVYGRPLTFSTDKPPAVVVFFPGDVQDYIENMEAHRDNRNYKQWNFEETVAILQKKFPTEHVLVVKPSRMDLKTFSCFQNFVESSDLGVPRHIPNYNSLRHFETLLENASKRLNLGPDITHSKYTIVGFSKGCVVLNQFLYEFHSNFTSPDKDENVVKIMRKITDMYWLDGGHSGGKNTWINDKSVLNTLVNLNIAVHVHVSPYQIRDERRPWIRKEEKGFSDYLQKNGCKFERRVHFESLPPSILTHFDVIHAFKE